MKSKKFEAPEIMTDLVSQLVQQHAANSETFVMTTEQEESWQLLPATDKQKKTLRETYKIKFKDASIAKGGLNKLEAHRILEHQFACGNGPLTKNQLDALTEKFKFATKDVYQLTYRQAENLMKTIVGKKDECIPEGVPKSESDIFRNEKHPRKKKKA